MNSIEQKSMWQEPDMPLVQAEAPMGVAKVIWHHKWIILLILILCVAGGAGYLLLVKPTYSSTALLYVEQGSQLIGADQESRIPPNYAYTEAQVVQSLPVLSMALQQPGILNLATFQGQDDPIKTLQDSLDARVGEKDDIINVTVSTTSAQESAKIAQAVVDSFLSYHATHKRSNASEMLKILEKDKNAQTQKRSDLLRAMLKFKQDNQALSFDMDKINLVMERISTLSTVLTAAHLEAIQTDAEYEAGVKAAGDSARLIGIMESQQLTGSRNGLDVEDSTLRVTLNQLQLQLATLRQEVSEDSPSVKQVQAKIESVKSQLAEREKRFADSYLSYMRQRKEGAEQKLAKLQEAYDRQHKEAQETNVKGTEYAILDADLKRAERTCDLLDARIKEINLTGDTGAMNIAVLQPPQAPLQPSKPKQILVLAGSLAMGLLFGFGWVIARERMDVRVRTGTEIASIVSAPVLGVVPRMPRPRSFATTGKYVMAHAGSAIAEAYRTIRTNIFCRAPKDGGVVLQITSPSANDGKTTLVSNLGISMAQSGCKTLIVDADLLNPTQHKIFSLSEDGGLRAMLTGAAGLSHCVKSSGLDNLDVMPCGIDGANISELLSGSAFEDLLRELSLKYRYILVDSPPIGSQADSRILAARCDATVLVLKAGQSDRMATQHARNGIIDAGGKILGVVVNAIDGKVHHYSYSGFHRVEPVKVEQVATEKLPASVA